MPTACGTNNITAFLFSNLSQESVNTIPKVRLVGRTHTRRVYRSVADLEQERRASTLVYATPESLQEAANAQADAAKPPPPPRPSLSMESVQPKKRLYKVAELSSRVLMEILGKRGVDIPANANRKELVVLVEAHGGVTASVRPKKR